MEILKTGLKEFGFSDYQTSVIMRYPTIYKKIDADGIANFVLSDEESTIKDFWTLVNNRQTREKIYKKGSANTVLQNIEGKKMLIMKFSYSERGNYLHILS